MTNPPNQVQCPECGADNEARVERCWLCGRRLGDVAAAASPESAANPYAAPRGLEVEQTQFGLSSLFLIITLVCICLGLWSLAPGLIVPLLVIAVPAFVRTLAATSRSTQRGAHLTVGDKIAKFVTSVAVVVVILTLIFTGAGIAFGTACALAFASNRAPSAGQLTFLIVLAIAGVVGSFALGIWLFVKTWPKKK